MIERENDPNSPSSLAAKKTPEEIQEDVRRARSVIKEDIRELGERFKPEHLKQNAMDARYSAKDHALEAVSERGRRAAGAAKNVVQENGAPLLLIGLGAGWLLMSQAKKRRAQQEWYEPSGGAAFESGGYRGAFQGAGYPGEYARERSPDAASYAGRSEAYGSDSGYAAERAGFPAEPLARDEVWSGSPPQGEPGPSRTQRLREGLGRYREQLHDKRAHLMDVSRERAQHARARSRDFASENPLAVGAAILAAGVGIGMLLPETRRENQLLGPTRDRLIGQARGIAQEVRGTAGQLGETTRTAASEVKDVLKVTERGIH
jgi:ElaB/YqjD/DUF883 family membrane-anchored ribosome-binding protein